MGFTINSHKVSLFLKRVLLLGILYAGTASAVSIFPNRVTVSGKPGEKAVVQIKIYGHPEVTTVEFVKAIDLKSIDDKVITIFELGAEQQYIIPLDIVIPQETQEYYLCAVLRKSQSMRLRVCSAVRAIVKQ